MMLFHITQLMVDPHVVVNQVHGIIPVLNDVATTLQHLAPDPPAPPNGNGNAYQQITRFATSIEGLIRALGFTIFLIGIAIAGIMRMVSFGSDRRVAMSNMALTAAIVGLVIMLMGTTLSNLLQDAFKTVK